MSDPTPAECGPLPSTALEFVMLDPWWGPACFDDAEMHFRAWSPECDWCGGSDVPTDEGSAWLFDAPSLVLLPAVSDYISGQSAVIYPDLKMQADWTDAWIEVTGHYADPAAEHCADLAQLLGVSASDPFYYVWRQGARDSCRQRFVITAVEVVDGA